MTLMTSRHDVVAAFKARWLFQTVNLELRCNLCTDKCEHKALENSDTFDSWLCDFGGFLTVMLLNAYSTCHQWSFRFKGLSVTYGISSVQQDAIAKIKCYVVKKV